MEIAAAIHRRKIPFERFVVDSDDGLQVFVDSVGACIRFLEETCDGATIPEEALSCKHPTALGTVALRTTTLGTLASYL